MSLNIGNGINNYNALFASIQKSGKQKTKASSQMDFASMGTIRNAVIQQKAKEEINSRVEKNNEKLLYEEKLTWYGIDITNNPDAHKVTVPLSSDVKEKISEIVRKDFEETGRKSKDDVSIMESFYKLCDKTVSNIKGVEKLKTAWSMSQYKDEIHSKIESKIRELDPKWDWGQPVKKEVLSKVFSKSLDVSV